MANKFQLSVQERLEQEAARKTSTAITSSPEPEPPEEQSSAAPDGTYPDISDFLRRSPQRMAKNKTFYLDAAVIDAIKATAKSQNVTDSKLVNDILRMILIGK